MTAAHDAALAAKSRRAALEVALQQQATRPIGAVIARAEWGKGWLTVDDVPIRASHTRARIVTIEHFLIALREHGFEPAVAINRYTDLHSIPLRKATR